MRYRIRWRVSFGYEVEWNRPQRGAIKQVKIIIEKHADGYVAYPVGIQGVVVGEGDTRGEALRDVQSALKFHVESFGAQAP
jgi:predicted RNase H-like HicB family nuclease